MDSTGYLENLARRIETAARTEKNKAMLFKIADDIRRYKRDKYDLPTLQEELGLEHTVLGNRNNNDV